VIGVSILTTLFVFCLVECWDGPDGLPVIYRGRTLTSKIRFLDVLKTIKEHAWVTSEWVFVCRSSDFVDIDQGSHQPGKPGKVGEFDSGQGKVRETGKGQCFARGVLPRLRRSQNKHSLIAWVLLSVDDMSVMDCQRSKQKLILPIHIIVIMFYLSHFYTVIAIS